MTPAEEYQLELKKAIKRGKRKQRKNKKKFNAIKSKAVTYNGK